MAEKMVAVGAGIMASDCDSPLLRQGLSVLALTAAGIGTARAEEQRGVYQRYIAQCLEEFMNVSPAI